MLYKLSFILNCHVVIHLIIDFYFLKYYVQILKDLGVQTLKLMTNNPTKCIALSGYGLEIVDRVPVLTVITKDNKRYLDTKGAKMGHVYGAGTLN